MNPEEIPAWKPFLKRIPLFKDLADEDLLKVAAMLKPLSLPRGATLFQQGDAGDAFYIVTSGQIRTTSERQGKTGLTAYHGRGDTFGELSLLTGEPRSMTAILDTTAEFLVLSKHDFTTILRETPGVHFQLSRTLSARILSETAGEGMRTALPKVYSVLCALEAADRRIFNLETALALVEQTRRRVLLIDMADDAGACARAFGLPAKSVDEDELREADLRDPAVLSRIVQPHASGLGIITLPSAVLSGRLYRSIFLLMNLVRERCDFVFIVLPSELGDVERSVLFESDRWLLAGRKNQRDSFSRLKGLLEGFVPESKGILEVWLGEEFEGTHPVRSGRDVERVRIPWNDELAAAHGRGESPFQILLTHERSRFGVESLARRIGGLRVGLALGTGAALGYSLIGILKAFKKENIPIDVLSGTSIGSLIGGFHALGLSPEQIEEIALGVDKAWVWENLFWDMTVPRSGLFAGTTLLRFIKSYFGEREFSDLDIPYACVATDIETGEGVLFREGRVAEAIRASCGIPLIFQPFQHQGRFLVDGGLVDPVPISAVSQMGADLLVAVNLTVPAGERKTGLQRKREESQPFERLKKMTLPTAFQAPNFFQVFFQMIYTMEYEIAKTRESMAHVYIHPDLSGFSWTEMHRAKDIILAGESVAAAVVPKIKSMLPFFANSCRIDARGGW